MEGVKVVMKVDIVNQNVESARARTNNKVQNRAPQQSFTGISPLERDMMDLIHHKKAILRMKKLEWLKGEIGGILITALGTGAVAPIFIGFNPFVRPKKNATPEEIEDTANTKKYTAMRQPISAALAILFQASILKYIDRFLDTRFNNPSKARAFDKELDQSYLNTETYIKRNVKQELKKQGIKKPSLFKSWFGHKEVVDGQKVSQRTRYDILVNDMVDKIRNEQINNIADAFKEDHRIYIGGELAEDGSVRLGRARNLDEKTVAELVNKQINEYQKDAEKLIKDKTKITEYIDKAETFINNENKLRKMFANNPWEEIKNTNDPKKLKELYGKTTEMLENLLKNESNPKIKEILNELLGEPEDLRAYKVQRTLNRIDYIKDMCKDEEGVSRNFTRARYHKALIERNNVLHRIDNLLESCKIKDVAKATEASIEAAIKKTIRCLTFEKGNRLEEAVLRHTDTFSNDPRVLKDKVYKDIVKRYKDLVKDSYKCWNQVSKIMVGVCITLPITCTALNWVYPRFMELFFPKLAGAKKKACNNKQQAQNGPQFQKAGGDK